MVSCFAPITKVGMVKVFILSETLRIPEDYRNLVLQTTDLEQTGDI